MFLGSIFKSFGQITLKLLLPKSLHNDTAEEAKLDASARGIHSTFFDVRVTRRFAMSNVVLSLEKLYNKHETEKMNLFKEIIEEVEKWSSSPLVFPTTGGMGSQCTLVMI